MEDRVANDREMKQSGATYDVALSQSDNLLIDVSSSSNLTEYLSSGAVELNAEEMPKLHPTAEPEKTGKNGKFNLRKSLAWDSAFFTSDGVLDAEELSTMIEGGEKVVKNQLPGIEEEVYRSMESISTLESDNLALETLEAELFDDIRASIQKSNNRSSNLNNNSSIKVPSVKKDTQEKVNSSSKMANLDSGKRPATRVKDQTSQIPKLNMMNRVKSTSTITTKRDSLNTSHAKKDQETVKQAQAIHKGTQATKPTTTQGSKITKVNGPQRGVPKPTIKSTSSSLKSTSSSLKSTSASLKSTSSSLKSSLEPSRPSSSSGSSSSSRNDLKSSTTTLSRKKTDIPLKTGKPATTTGPIPKTPSRIITKNKAPPVNSRLSSHSVLSSSSTNLSSNVSPASSISEWSCDSSSSLSSLSRGKTGNSIDSNRSLDGGFETVLKSVGPTGVDLSQNGNNHRMSQGGLVSRPANFQPTGLRMPSPKIGFFDGGKSGVRTPNGGIRPQCKLPTGPQKAGPTNGSPNTTSNGVKYGKLLPPKTTSSSHTNLKPNPQKTTPKTSQEQAKSKTPKTIKSSLETSNMLDEIKIVSAAESESRNETRMENEKNSLEASDVFDHNKDEIKIVSAENDSSLSICVKNETHLENETFSKNEKSSVEAYEVLDQIKIVSAENDSGLNKNESVNETFSKNKIASLEASGVLDHKDEIKIDSAKNDSCLSICVEKESCSEKETFSKNEKSSLEASDVSDHNKEEIKIVSTAETDLSLNENESRKESCLENEISPLEASDEIKIVSAESESGLDICVKNETLLENEKSSLEASDVMDHEIKAEIDSSVINESINESHLENEMFSKIEKSSDASEGEIKTVSAESELGLDICAKNESMNKSCLDHTDEIKITESRHETRLENEKISLNQEAVYDVSEDVINIVCGEIDSCLNKIESHLENESEIARSDDKVKKFVTDGLMRNPFGVKNSTNMEVTEKTVNFPLMESEEFKENSEINI